MLTLQAIFVVLFGLAFGSFLNVCIYRLPRGEGIAHPPSRCIRCGKPLAALENIPIISWLWLRGRARCCGGAIPWKYPIVEGLTALLWLGCFFKYGLNVAGIGFMVLCWLLLGLAWMDAETFLLPDAFTLPGILMGLSFAVLRAWVDHEGWPAFTGAVLSALALSAGFLAVGLLYRLLRGREGLGLGDVKLAAMLGAWFGWKAGLLAIFLGIVGGAIGGWVVLMRRSANGETGPAGSIRLALGAYMAAAGIVVVFVGEPLLRWYSGFFPAVY